VSIPSKTDGMDAINSLIGGTQRAQAAFDAAAQQIASVDLPTAKSPDPTNPVSPTPPGVNEVDVAQQMIAMTVAADTHHATTAALRAAFSMYQDTLDLIPQHPVR
jgi:flagellar basal body rod protein FlgC